MDLSKEFHEFIQSGKKPLPDMAQPDVDGDYFDEAIKKIHLMTEAQAKYFLEKSLLLNKAQQDIIKKILKPSN